MRDLKVGDEVYYTYEDYKTGDDVIYKSKIKKIVKQDITLGNKVLKDKIFYWLESGIVLMRNACYTIEELFEMKERLEEIKNAFEIEKLLDKSNE